MKKLFVLCMFVLVLVSLMVMGDIELVSVASDGTQGNNYSILPSLSADGKYVAFFSMADNLVPNDINPYADVFVYSPPIPGPTTINEYIQALSDDCFSKNAKNQKKTFENKLTEVQQMIDAGYYQDAINKLVHDIRPKVGIGKDGAR